MEQFLTLFVVFLVVTFFNWLQNRTRAAEEAAGGPPQPEDGAPRSRTDSEPGELPPPPRRPASVDWEAELRRLLEGETAPEASAPPPPAPPPPSRPIAVPIPVQRPVPAPARRVTAPPPLPVMDELEAAAGRMAPMIESSSAHRRDNSLERKVADQMRDVHEKPVVITGVTRLRENSRELAATANAFRSPRAARQAMIASIVLAPPKALESM
jgi:hypothetical protein